MPQALLNIGSPTFDKYLNHYLFNIIFWSIIKFWEELSFKCAYVNRNLSVYYAKPENIKYVHFHAFCVSIDKLFLTEILKFVFTFNNDFVKYKFIKISYVCYNGQRCNTYNFVFFFKNYFISNVKSQSKLSEFSGYFLKNLLRTENSCLRSI